MASVAAAGMFALAVALGCACILAPALDSLDAASPRGAALDAAALVTLPVTYLLGVVLVYLHVAPAAPVVPPGAARRLAALACAAASASASLAAFMSLMSLSGAGGSPPGCGQ